MFPLGDLAYLGRQLHYIFTLYYLSLKLKEFLSVLFPKCCFLISLSVCVVGMRYFIPEKDTPFFEAVLEREGVSSDAEAILKRS